MRIQARVVSVVAALWALAGPAGAVTVSMSVDAPSCSGFSSGVGSCDVTGRSQISVTWQLDVSTKLNGYDFEIRWDAGELGLISSTQLYPDSGTPGPFLVEPSDPSDSRALVTSLTAAHTVQLFRMTFSASPEPADGQADISWFANGNGLSPVTVTLDNPAGAGIDLSEEALAVPVMGERGHALLAISLLCIAGHVAGLMRRIRRRGDGNRAAATAG